MLTLVKIYGGIDAESTDFEEIRNFSGQRTFLPNTSYFWNPATYTHHKCSELEQDPVPEQRFRKQFSL